MKKYWKNAKKTGKVREIRQSKKVGTVCCYNSAFTTATYEIITATDDVTAATDDVMYIICILLLHHTPVARELWYHTPRCLPKQDFFSL